MTETHTTVDVREVRRRPRFKLRGRLDATFAGLPATVTDVSADGLGLRHTSPIRISSPGPVKIESNENTSGVSIRARVRWSRLSTTKDADGNPLYLSGLQVEDDSDAAAGLLGRIIRAMGERDADSLEQKKRLAVAKAEALASRPALITPRPAVPRISSDQVLLIREASRALENHPDSAQEWYNRAKYSLAKRGLSNEDVKNASHRREVIVIWEYLSGKIDLDVIAEVLDTSRAGASDPVSE